LKAAEERRLYSLLKNTYGNIWKYYLEEYIKDMNGKLRVALWLESYSVPAWFYMCIAKVVQSHYAEIILMIVSSFGVSDAVLDDEEMNNLRFERKIALKESNYVNRIK